MPAVGFLGDGTPELRASHVRAFRQGLSEQGYAEGRNFAFEFRPLAARAQQPAMP
jgi:hypothetical protein